MKIAKFSKIVAIIALASAPMVVQAQGVQREGAKLGSSEMLAIGGLIAALAAVAAASGGALATDEDPASA